MDRRMDGWMNGYQHGATTIHFYIQYNAKHDQKVQKLFDVYYFLMTNEMRMFLIVLFVIILVHLHQSD